MPKPGSRQAVSLRSALAVPLVGQQLRGDLGGQAPQFALELADLARQGPDLADELLVLGNEHLLGRAVSNLLDNAARHARATVTVTLVESDAAVTLTNQRRDMSYLKPARLAFLDGAA